jgi:hypothetical protein
LLSVIALGGSAFADAEEVRRAATWPVTLGLNAMIGAAFANPGAGSPDRTPVAFGVSAELLWRGRVGGFAGLLSTSGLIVPPVGGDAAAPDRISVPFGLAFRPLVVAMGERQSWASRLARGVVIQTGVSVENLRSSDQNHTVAAFHLAAGVDVPLWGSVTEGGVALRVYARGIFQPEVHLHAGETRELFAPNATGQLLVGFCYTP